MLRGGEFTVVDSESEIGDAAMIEETRLYK